MTHSFLLFMIYALCVYRLTRLVVEDTITEPIRKKIEARSTTAQRNASSVWLVIDKDKPWIWRKLYAVTSCHWCISVWIAAGVVITAHYTGNWFAEACCVPALSAVTGHLSGKH